MLYEFLYIIELYVTIQQLYHNLQSQFIIAVYQVKDQKVLIKISTNHSTLPWQNDPCDIAPLCLFQPYHLHTAALCCFQLFNVELKSTNILDDATSNLTLKQKETNKTVGSTSNTEQLYVNSTAGRGTREL